MDLGMKNYTLLIAPTTENIFFLIYLHELWNSADYNYQ